MLLYPHPVVNKQAVFIKLSGDPSSYESVSDTALYMVALSAARYNPVIKPFYDRLRAVSKPAKVARCATARKLLHLAFAVAIYQEVLIRSISQRDSGKLPLHKRIESSIF